MPLTLLKDQWEWGAWSSCWQPQVKHYQRRNNRTAYANAVLKCTQICNQHIVIYIYTHTKDIRQTLVIMRFSFPKSISSSERGCWLRRWEGRSAFWLGLRSRGCVSRHVYKPGKFMRTSNSISERCSSVTLREQSCSWSRELAASRTNENKATGH